MDRSNTDKPAFIKALDDASWDATESIQEYQKGKVWNCKCGHGIGTTMEKIIVRCASCHLILYDTKSDEREPPKRDTGQSGLGDWV